MKSRPAETCDLLCLDLPTAERIRTALPAMELLETASAAGRAAADSTRLAIAAALVAGDELCVCDLSWIVGRSQNLVSHHLRALREGGLATSRRDGKLVMYRLTALGATVLQVLLPEADVTVPGVRGIDHDHAGAGRGVVGGYR